MPFRRHIADRLTSFRFDRGSISVIAAIGMVPVLVLGSSCRFGSHLAERLALQSAVEVAALSGAYEQLSGGLACSNAAAEVTAALRNTHGELSCHRQRGHR